MMSRSHLLLVLITILAAPLGCRMRNNANNSQTQDDRSQAPQKQLFSTNKMSVPIDSLLQPGESFRWFSDEELKIFVDTSSTVKPELRANALENLKLRRDWLVQDIGADAFYYAIDFSWNEHGTYMEKVLWLDDAKREVLNQLAGWRAEILAKNKKPEGRYYYLCKAMPSTYETSRKFELAKHRFLQWNEQERRYDFVINESTIKFLNSIQGTAAGRASQRSESTQKAQRDYEARLKQEQDQRKCEYSTNYSCGSKYEQPPIKVHLNGAG